MFGIVWDEFSVIPVSPRKERIWDLERGLGKFCTAATFASSGLNLPHPTTSPKYEQEDTAHLLVTPGSQASLSQLLQNND